MNPPTRLGRAILAVRRIFNAIDLKVYGIALAGITFILLWVLMGSAYLPGRYDLKAGDVAQDYISAPRTLTFENKAETDRQRQQAAAAVPNVYTFDATVLRGVTHDVGDFFDNVSRIVTSERAAAQAAGTPYDPAQAVKGIQALPGLPQISQASLTALASLPPDRLAAVKSAVLSSEELILEGNVTQDSLANDKDRLKSVLGTRPLSAPELAAAAEVGGAYLKPNNVLSPEKTQAAKDRAAAAVQPAEVTVQNGETIVTPGQVVTQDIAGELQALGLAQQGGRFGTLAGIGLLALIEVLILALYINRFEQRVRGSRSLMFIVASLLVLFTGIARVSVEAPLSPLIVPLAALGMLGTLMLQTRLSAFLVVLTSIDLAVVGGSDPQFVVMALLGGIAGVFLVTNVTQRRDLLKAGVYASLVVVVTAIGASQIGQSSWSRAGAALAWGVGNGFLSMIATLGLITIYEMVFNLPTPLKLLELADPTRPLLKELMMKAPGTYNHSIIMGNIAETAAEAIGANPLLARVGAYYHDIGKLNRPDYFIENQFHIKNPHDRLTPGLSKLAITAHVRDGVRLARDEGLPPEILDIIKEHHGTTVLAYFYHKAIETSGAQPVDEETYRYAGQKPASREAAIIMLADSVEAAVRSLKNPTMKSIKTVIRDIFDHRLRDGQLSESKMTFGDLDKVRQVFEKSLRGFSATRIAYPSPREGSALPVSARARTGARSGKPQRPAHGAGGGQ